MRILLVLSLGAIGVWFQVYLIQVSINNLRSIYEQIGSKASIEPEDIRPGVN